MRELPPTAGLPVQWRDLLPRRADADLESRLRTILGIGELQITCSGTAALVTALITLSRNSARSEVIVPAYTCPLVAMAVTHSGLRLRVCDLMRDGLALDTDMLASLCSSRTLAILPTHLGGRVADIGATRDCAAHYGVWVIEDAAQALGARHPDGTPVGMLGDIGVYSLAAGKGLTMYEGGLLVSRHAELRAKMRVVANELAPKKRWWELRRSIELVGYAAFYRPRGLQWVYGMPLRRALSEHDFDAAAGDRYRMRIPLHRVGNWRRGVAARAAVRLPEHLATLQQQARRRIAHLQEIPGVEVMGDAPGAQGVWPVLMLCMPDGHSRDGVLARLWGAGMGLGIPFAHALPDYQGLQDMVPRLAVPNARDFAARVLTISNTPWLDDATFIRIVEVIRQVCDPGAAVRPSVSMRARATTPD
ncbi:DegT/DnrJ/EryC1/StrS family aminotransferase [Thermomonas sp.]